MNTYKEYVVEKSSNLIFNLIRLKRFSVKGLTFKTGKSRELLSSKTLFRGSISQCKSFVDLLDSSHLKLK